MDHGDILEQTSFSEKKGRYIEGCRISLILSTAKTFLSSSSTAVLVPLLETKICSLEMRKKWTRTQLGEKNTKKNQDGLLNPVSNLKFLHLFNPSITGFIWEFFIPHYSTYLPVDQQFIPYLLLTASPKKCLFLNYCLVQAKKKSPFLLILVVCMTFGFEHFLQQITWLGLAEFKHSYSLKTFHRSFRSNTSSHLIRYVNKRPLLLMDGDSHAIRFSL